jgi:hypothetical protein
MSRKNKGELDATRGKLGVGASPHGGVLNNKLLDVINETIAPDSVDHINPVVATSHIRS